MLKCHACGCNFARHQNYDLVGDTGCQHCRDSHSSRTIFCICANNQCYWKFIMNPWHLPYSSRQYHVCKTHLEETDIHFSSGRFRKRTRKREGEKHLGKYLRLKRGVDNRQVHRSLSNFPADASQQVLKEKRRQTCSFTSVCVDWDGVLIRILMTHRLACIQWSVCHRAARAAAAGAVLSIHSRISTYGISTKGK